MTVLTKEQKVEAHKERNRQSAKRWYVEHRERAIKTRNLWVEKNKERVREKQKKWAHRNKERIGTLARLRRYGLNVESFRKIMDGQNSLCAICKRKIGQKKRDTHVDHCHDTGTVRGLLCVKCNTGLGHFDDDPAILEVARLYILGANGENGDNTERSNNG